MAIKTDPLAMATHGVIKTGGATDPLGLASFGLIVVDGGAPPGGGDTDGRKRRTYFTMIGRSRLGR